MSHFPLLPLAAALHDAGLKHAGDLTDLDERARQLAAFTEPAVVLHGHLHVRAATVAHSTLQLSFAALVEPPHECAIVEVRESSEGDVEIERTTISVLDYDAPVVPVLSPDHERWVWTGRGWDER